MMKRKQLAVGGLILFVAGTLIVPAMHRLELARAEGCPAAASRCAHSHQDNDGAQHGEQDKSGDGRSRQQSHDPSSCSICRLANTPVNTAVAAIEIPQCELVSAYYPTTPMAPDFNIPRLLPFSCGPPS